MYHFCRLTQWKVEELRMNWIDGVLTKRDMALILERGVNA